MPLGPQSAYTPTSDVPPRRDYGGVTKSRKTASTGGGRAWSEEEVRHPPPQAPQPPPPPEPPTNTAQELYLLQTRLQKMPYKHIAAHLKKTELACRLHYHQLSHGNNRRKRATSVSSGSSNGRSPHMPLAVGSPREAPASTSRSSTPPGTGGNYIPSSPHGSGLGGVQLPSIVGSHASPHLPAILPKPAAMTLPPLSRTASSSGFPHDPHSAPSSLPPLGPSTPPLRLECALPPPTPHTHVDMSRLQSIYAAHRAPFWAAVAAEYGAANPAALEQAWRAGGCCGGTPLTPAASPDRVEREGRDRTRISALLGTEVRPRSPQDEMMVRRMEERCVVAGV